MQNLPQVDSEFADKIQSAGENGEVLRYVGTIGDGKCAVKSI